jgi:hypothetical protein
MHTIFSSDSIKEEIDLKHRCKWENNIKMDLKDVMCEDVDWN